MSVTPDILACYRRPRVVFERRAAGNEGTAFSYVIIAGIMVFVGLLPGLARQAHLFPDAGNLPSLVFGAFLGAVFMAPILMYLISVLLWTVLRLSGFGLSGLRVRLVLFWSYLAVAPLMLLRGLTEGFVGPGPSLTLVGAITGLTFLLFLSIGLRIGLKAKRGADATEL